MVHNEPKMVSFNRLLIASIIGTGISSVTIQLITIREFLTQFHGNEITISMVLFIWLLLTGLGSLAAKVIRPSSPSLYSVLVLVIALWPLPQILLIRHFREVLFIHGISPGFYQILLYIASTIIPYCFLGGFILPYALEVLKSNRYDFDSGQLYITDNIGDILGGGIFSFLLVYLLKPFKTIAITSAFLILTAFFLLRASGRYYLLLISVILSSVFYFFSLNGGFEVSVLSKQYGDIIHYFESPYGRILVTREGPQKTLWESGVPIYSDANLIPSEEKIHYPLSQLEKIGNVLLVSGGLGSTLKEVMKYEPAHIDYVELDPHLTEAAQKSGFLKQRPALDIINRDARDFIKNTDRKYDAVILDLPDPDTFQINRFYTDEFFSLVKRTLQGGGILSFGMEYSPNFISDIRKQKFSAVYNTVVMHFKNVKVIPGQQAYFLCRDGEISVDIPARLEAKSISTEYIEGFYYGDVTPERIGQLQESLDSNEFINTDFEPRLMNISFKEWFSKHGNSPNIFLFAFVLVTALHLICMKKEEYVLFTTGIAGMGTEMLIVFSFQIIYGYIYLKIGAIVTVFLLGLLPGALIGASYKNKNIVRLLTSEVILLCLLLGFFVWISLIKGEPGPFYFLLYGFLFSFFCGFQFPVVTAIMGEKTSPAAGCLAADLAGAALGTLLVGTVLIPLSGVQTAVIFLILVKISSSVLILFPKKKSFRVLSG